MAGQVESLIFLRIVSFLEHGHIVNAAFVEITVLIGVDGVNFHTHHAEIFSCELAGFTDILHITLRTAFAGKDQDLLHPGIGNDLHFIFNLLHIQLHAVDMVITVEAAVNTVVLAIIGDIQRGK